MAWFNIFGRVDENARHVWGYTFQWTPQHMTKEQMYPLKYSYDTLGEEALNRLDKISPARDAALPRNQPRSPSEKDNTAPKRDLYALLRDHASEDEVLGKLWDEVNTIPSWVDWDQIARGQNVFYRYGGAALTALTFQSLLGGMAAGRVTEVLARTGGFATRVARRRMYETTQHVLQVTESLDSIKPGGAGFASSIRVRLLHAAVRQRIMKLARENPEYYSVEMFGIPINDLDSVATIGTFSATLIWLGLPRQGIWLREQEIVDFIALWRVVAHYLGTPTEYFATPETAKAMHDSILLSEVHPTQTSKMLANNIILALQGRAPLYASRHFLNANARWLNGDDLADALDIGRPSLYYKALVAGQCIFYMFICYIHRSIPSLDRKKLKTLRRLFWQVIVENKTHGLGGKESNFEFKYIPNFHTTTSLGEFEHSGLKEPGIERRNLRVLLYASAFFAVVSYLGVKITLGVVGGLRARYPYM